MAWRPLTSAGRDQLQAALAIAGVTVAEDAGTLLVTCDDYLDRELSVLAGVERRPWLLVNPTRDRVSIGPTFELRASTCLPCLAHWIRPRRAILAEKPAPAELVRSDAIDMIVQAAIELARGSPGREAAAIRTVDAATLRVSEIVVPARLRCTCKGPRSGTASTDAATNPITGIVLGLEHHVPVPGHLHHASSLHVYPDVQRGKRQRAEPSSAFGRGPRPSDCINACIAEAIERYSSVWQGTEPMVLARANELGAFLSPESILLFSDQQYATRPEWNRDHDARFNVPDPFDRDGRTYWSPVRSLLDGRMVFVPTALCYGGFDADSVVFGSADSIGCAAGATLEAAVLAAVLEKIERDAVAIWWYSRATRPVLDLSGCNEPGLRQALEEATHHSLLAQVLDVTTDIDVPCYVCVGTDSRGEVPCFGAAAHPDPVHAARKAVTEMLQMHFWSTRASLEPSVAHWLRTGALKTDPHLRGGEAIALPRFVGAAPSLLQWTVDRLASAGLEAFVLDLTRPEIGLPVARAIIPELRHCWHRLGRGRLYDVPVKLGWVGRALLESELNPAPCPL